MHVKSEERLVGVVPRVVTVGGERLGGHSRQGVVLGDFVDAQVLVTPTEKVVPRVGSSSVCRAPRKSNRPARIVTGPVSQGALLKFNGLGRTVTGLVSHGGVHSVALVPSVDLLDDVNFSKWVLEYGCDELHEFLFSYSGRTVSRDDIRSLAPRAHVSVGVINAWSCILNCRERTKDPSAPARVFASSFTTLNTAVLFKKIDRLKVARFSESLGADFALGSHRTWDDVHLLFFPILQLNHFYLLCVDFKTKRLEIIDNSASTEATRLKYGDTLENVKLLLTEYFTSVGEKFKSIICENLKCIRMPMKWRDTGNEVECGVYLMRHIESYVGERVSKWDCGLTRGDRLPA
nr:ulp1 protease family, C-terminal catalytic domain-containing protein [Ipomoea batatas]GME13469.1 ulp1 protease family, C-terminal catalytic domain-containing protein [Ipomoea batatas]